MAIPAQNIAYISAAAPVASGSGVLAFGGSSMQELSYIGTATFVGDGSLTTATLNYIDGTATLPFTPSAVLGFRIGGTAGATISLVSVVDNADSGKSAAVNFSAAPANTTTFKMVFFVLK